MSAHGIEYVPTTYRSDDIGRATLWAKGPPETWSEHVRDVAASVQDSIVAVESLLAFAPTRRIHVVVYADMDDSFAALGRRVSPTFLLAPLHALDRAVIVLHSIEADAGSGDVPRLRRHLCHELAHVFAAERTGSLKRLGDGNRDMRIRSWVNEGFAECVASLVGDRRDIVERALRTAAAVAMGPTELDEKLDDLACVERPLAFAIATTSVWRAIEQRGVRFVFERLDQPATWCVEGTS